MRKATIIIFALVIGTCSRSPGTLEEVLSSGELRVVTRNSPTTYFRGAGGLEGPEYLLVKGFAEFLSDKYDRPVIATFETIERFSEILPALENNQFHLAAAGLTVTDERSKRVVFGPDYQNVTQHLVYKLNTGKPRSLEDLQGKQLEIMSGSSYTETLERYRTDNPELSWSENPNADISELLLAVANQEIDYTIADTTDFEVHRDYLPELRSAMELKNGDKLAWAFRKYRSDEILDEAQEYFAQIRANGELEQILDRYYGHREEFDYVGTRTFIRHHDNRLHTYRGLFVDAGERTDTDWRLLAAIGYQESHWNPQAVSPTGVRGLMMLTRSTASTMGVTDREDPEQSILAGAEYFAKLRKRLSDIPEPDRTWFALAAYNIGYSHVRDAQRIVRMQNGNPDRWLDVKDALPKLAQQKWHSQVPFGYARGWVPVQYVSNVRTYYEILNWLTAEENPEESRKPQRIMTPRSPRLQTAAVRYIYSRT